MKGLRKMDMAGPEGQRDRQETTPKLEELGQEPDETGP